VIKLSKSKKPPVQDEASKLADHTA
jgi:hypothetical protein